MKMTFYFEITFLYKKSYAKDLHDVLLASIAVEEGCTEGCPLRKLDSQKF